MRCILLMALFLGGCSAEVASTAAVSAAAKAQEARQAQQSLERVREKLDAATQAGQQRATDTERTTGY